MKTLLLFAAALGCCWTLISSHYDPALGGFVCVYQSQAGTIIRQFQKGPCSPSPQ